MHHVAVVREPWLSMLLDGRKRVECRVGKRTPRAARAGVGDHVHLRPVGGAPVARMRVAAVDDWGFCTARDLREIAHLYADDLGIVTGTDVPYLTDHAEGAYVVMVWLENPGPSALTEWTPYHAWSLIDPTRQRRRAGAAPHTRRSP